jgi:TetR/AcrR family transcriptional regulator
MASVETLVPYRVPNDAEEIFALDVLRPEKKKHRRNAEETKKRILAAGENEFAVKGFDGARLATIAKAAEVQQALIHHYFSDKAGLYREVIAVALGAMSDQSWSILQRLAQPDSEPKIRELVEAIVSMVIDFYAEHAAILSILRHDSAATDELARAVVTEKAKPVFDAVVGYTEELRRRRLIRADVDAHHLCVSTLALATITVQDQRLLQGLWPIDPRSPEFLLKRKTEVTEMVISRIALRSNEASPSKSKLDAQGSGGMLERRSASNRSRRRRG